VCATVATTHQSTTFLYGDPITCLSKEGVSSLTTSIALPFLIPSQYFAGEVRILFPTTEHRMPGLNLKGRGGRLLRRHAFHQHVLRRGEQGERWGDSAQAQPRVRENVLQVPLFLVCSKIPRPVFIFSLRSVRCSFSLNVSCTPSPFSPPFLYPFLYPCLHPVSLLLSSSSSSCMHTFGWIQLSAARERCCPSTLSTALFSTTTHPRFPITPARAAATLKDCTTPDRCGAPAPLRMESTISWSVLHAKGKAASNMSARRWPQVPSPHT
jgi:hypothetical protein